MVLRRYDNLLPLWRMVWSLIQVQMNNSPAKTTTLLDLEDRANALTHGVGVGVALSGLVLMAVLSAASRDPWKIASVSIFGATLVLLFVSSMLYHSAADPKRRKALRVLDHISINLLIAGTYTPFLLVNMRANSGWALFWAIWGLALIGTIGELFFTGRFKLLSTVRYILMGWIILVALGPLVASVPFPSVVLLFVGGGVYSLGAVFYMLDKKIPFGHAVWHVFVIGGSVCHLLSVTLGVLPYRG